MKLKPTNPKRIIGGLIYLILLVLIMVFVVALGRWFPEFWEENGITPEADVKYLVTTFRYWYLYLLAGVGGFLYFFLRRGKTFLPCLCMVCLAYILIGYPYSTIFYVCGQSGLEAFRASCIYLLMAAGIIACFYLYRKNPAFPFLLTAGGLLVWGGYYYSTFEAVSCMKG
jgi:hypothetical protein